MCFGICKQDRGGGVHPLGVAFLVHGKVWNAVVVLPKQSVEWKGNLQLCKY